MLRSPEPHGAHEDGPEASVRGAVCAKPRSCREAGKGDSREFEFRYNRQPVFTSLSHVNVKKSSGVEATAYR